MDKRFLKAFLTPRATRLAGYDLFPWCLKHRLWLEALDHPILSGRPCTPAELIFFAKVCAEKPVGEVTLKDKWQAAKLKVPINYNTAINDAYDHMRVDCWPQFWERKESQAGGGRNRGMPWVLSIVANLVKAGHNLEDALNLPECQAIWLSCAASIQAGSELDILSTEDEALLDELQRVKDSPPKT
ncbi:MAG: hypothetical protein ACK5XN_17455 [Bacteroidota bacterium]